MKPYVFGIDLGGTTAKLGFFRSDGELIEKWSVPTRKEDHGVNLVPDLTASVKERMPVYGISAADVEGIGIGVPGAVHDDGLVEPCVNLDQWGGFKVYKAFEEATGIRTVAANDVNCAAMGEYSFGSGKGYRNVVMAALGTGIGAGIIIDGELINGTHGSAGEVGHIKVSTDEERTCGCGKKGCLEQYSSATGVAYLGAKILSESKKASSMRGFEDLSCKDVFDCASAGDEQALKVVDFMAARLGMALAAVSCVVDPEVFIIGGGVSAGGAILFDNVRKYFKRYAFPPCEETPVIPAALGNDAGIYGGLALIVNGHI